MFLFRTVFEPWNEGYGEHDGSLLLKMEATTG